ncbi:hypothetical protein [Arthrobacter sp. 31Y]|uniref:hypothetical protein n=1 Tax=Arthrobacter sp. 31Y TaxID=1115632 RepID=UPI000463D36F|nr:hypothetical protein [Arthrobacter sp. 31Y]
MTSRDSEREAMVDELLLDADAADSSDVRLALLSMGSFANLAAPTPGAELSAMLAGPHDEVSKRRWRHKHRTAVIGVAVVAAMGLGVSGVAASSSGFTRNPSFIDELLGNVRPQPAAAAPVLPIPDAPRVITEPAPVTDPAAIPTIPAAGSIPVPGSVAPPETPAQAQAQPQVQAPQQAPVVVQAPAAATKQPSSGAAPQPNTPPNPALSPQAKPGSGNEGKQQAARPDASLQGAGKPAKTLPGADGAKPGHLPPGLGNERAEEQFKDAANKWKQWLKRGDH